MKNNNKEMMNLFDFILENKDIIISDKGLFSRDTLILIRSIAKGKIPNDFELNEDQKEVIIKSFINSGKSFDENTPQFIINNRECIEVALSRDINSVNYLKSVDSNLEKYIIKKVLEQSFVLKNNSPEFLKRNFDIAKKSINEEAQSADFIEWYLMSYNETDELVNDCINGGYILSETSSEFLASNLDIALASIKRDQSTFKYVSSLIKEHTRIFEYLVLDEYDYETSYLTTRALQYFSNIDVFGKCLEKIGIYGNGAENEKYKSRINKLYFDAINSTPTLKTFDSVFRSFAEEKWKEYRNDNFDDYSNIFGKICVELRNSRSFQNAVDKLRFLTIMQDVLDEKYKTLYNAMKEYFDIYHSDTPNKLSKMENSKNIIANLSALYVAKRKESYKKRILKTHFSWIKKYFTLNLNSPYIEKKVVQKQKKQNFCMRYNLNDKEINDFLENLLEKYSKDIPREYVSRMISGFMFHNCTKFEQLTRPPRYYSDYKRYQKAIKLIHRLNNGYIEYDGVEMFNYRDIIQMNDEKQYVYTGRNFYKNDILQYESYIKKERVFKNIKKDISMKIQTMDFDENIDYDTIKTLSDELPFTDEYFVFDSEYFLNKHRLVDVCTQTLSSHFDLRNFTDDESFENMYHLLINNGLFWLLLIINSNTNYELNRFGVNSSTIFGIMENMFDLTKLEKEFNFDIKEFKELMTVYKMKNCADNESMAILGKEIIEKLYKCKDFTSNDEEEIISMAKELVCQMAKKDKSTVPYINGKTLNYEYSVYDSQDETVLLSGIYTDACFRVDGSDNDFFHYCTLDKNGFVIKITDEFGKFIARASGFRNGNCVFINQLRTIYDRCGNLYRGNYVSEQHDIIETFKKACEDIVDISQNNVEEKNKIDFVFVTQSYALDDYRSNVSDEVEREIGYVPMDTQSEDWQNFVNNTKNLQEKDEEGFTTDYGDYALICMASSKQKIKSKDIKKYDAPAVYRRKRNKIIITDKVEQSIIQKINKIRAVEAYLNEVKFNPINIVENSVVFTGDNWYIIYNDGNIISYSLLEFDSKACIEFEATRQIILDNTKQINYEQLIENLQATYSDYCVKVLKAKN